MLPWLTSSAPMQYEAFERWSEREQQRNRIACAQEYLMCLCVLHFSILHFMFQSAQLLIQCLWFNNSTRNTFRSVRISGKFSFCLARDQSSVLFYACYSMENSNFNWVASFIALVLWLYCVYILLYACVKCTFSLLQDPINWGHSWKRQLALS